MILPAIILALSLFSSPVKCQNNDNKERSLSTSIAGLEELLETERQLLISFENYARALEAKVTVIRSAIAAASAENLKSAQNAEEYLSNPLNSYALIRSMHTDWIHWEVFMQKPVGEVEIAMIQNLRINLPTSIDMDEATTSIHRLQTTYDLKVEEIAAGLLNGKQYNASLSSRDCFEIGQRLFTRGEVLDASYWLNTALQRYQENEINAVLDFDKFKIIDLYAETCLKQNKFLEALTAINTALQLNPHNAKYLKKKLRIENEMINDNETPEELPTNVPNIYQRCCRGDFDNRLSRLHCRYNTTTHAFLQLAPLKMEELSLTDPYMVLYHDVISDAEIDEIQKYALPKLERTKIVVEMNDSAPSNVRISKACWFADNTSNATERIVQRIADMSGFILRHDHFEMMQVSNYGLGGYYIQHYDAFNKSQDSDELRGRGDRISTIMFYLSDVDQGGATVFPNLERTVYPRKGSALMWYNLNNHGGVDPDSLHAACPVIVGSKWIITRWMRENDQMFRRKCY